MPKLTDITILTTPDKLDVIHVVDVSDTSSDANGTSKQVVLEKLPFIMVDATPINNQVDNYTIILSDINRLVRMNKATAVTVTVPTDTSLEFPIGAEVAFEQAGVGTLTIAGEDGTVLLHHSSVTLGFNTQYSTGAIKKVDVNTWLVAGDLI